MADSDWKQRNGKWRAEMEPVRDKWERLRMYQCGYLSDEHIAERDEQLLAIDVKYGMTNSVTTIETPLELIDDFLRSLKAVGVVREGREIAIGYHQIKAWIEQHERDLIDCEHMAAKLCDSLFDKGVDFEEPEGVRRLEAVSAALTNYERWANRIKDEIND